jgi:hypothetical protein
MVYNLCTKVFLYVQYVKSKAIGNGEDEKKVTGPKEDDNSIHSGLRSQILCRRKEIVQTFE